MLGMANFYPKFKKRFSQMAKLFLGFFKKELSFEWKEEQHRALKI
jgi:hypothetical protein